jgi:hypothetical protein
MGLTISYQLRFSGTVKLVREKILALHTIARELDFPWVGEIVELEGDECKLDMEDLEDPHAFLKIRASKLLGVSQDGSFSFQHPNYFIGFDTLPGQGCETAAFGLAIHSDLAETNDWSWTGFCKTQYASNPEYGGLEHFFRCHLQVIQMLDAAQSLGIQCKVTDGGNYWETRDKSVLAAALNQYNFLVASVIGHFKDGSTKIEAPILEYPNFEYLEAEGQELRSRDEKLD